MLHSFGRGCADWDESRCVLSDFLEPKHLPCPDCGASVARGESDAHECERERWLDYQLFQQREELERLGSEVTGYLDSPQGRFELWYAERERQRRTQ